MREALKEERKGENDTYEDWGMAEYAHLNASSRLSLSYSFSKPNLLLAMFFVPPNMARS